MRDLKETGRCREAPVLYKSDTSRLGFSARVRLESFQPFHEVTRDDIPGYGDHKILFSDPVNNAILAPVVRVFLSGSQLCHRVGHRSIVWPIPEQASEVGSVFLKRDGRASLGIFPYDRDAIEIGSRVKRDPLVRAIAKRASNIIMSTDGDGAVRIDELQRNAVQWLVDDGIAAKWLREVLDYVKVLDVMST